MAILSNGKFYGFLCSVKETGRQLANGVKEYVEDFVSGFAGHGWKIWEYVKGKWMLEIDSIRVRGQFTVFEMLISKVRAIIGAQTITQGCGKIKTVSLSEDGTAYLITLEDEDMSFMEHDFIRCQEFTGEKRMYHVEIESVTDGVIRIPVSEFELNEEGVVMNSPSPGDDIVQFGNSSHDEKYVGRHSAIYMHADETGAPAIDVLDGIYSKDWSDCLKVRMGGNIPGNEGMKGLYCVNGMIKGVAEDGVVVYQINPDGSASFAKGRLSWTKDGSPHFSGTIQVETDGENVWEVDEKCINTVGNKSGKRVVISPTTQDIRIFDANNKQVITFEGNEYKTDDFYGGNLPHLDIGAGLIPFTLNVKEYNKLNNVSVTLTATPIEVKNNSTFLSFDISFLVNITDSKNGSYGEIKISYFVIDDNDVLIKDITINKFIVTSENNSSAMIMPGFYEKLPVGRIYLQVSFKGLLLQSGGQVLLQLTRFDGKIIVAGYNSSFFSNGIMLGDSSENMFSIVNEDFNEAISPPYTYLKARMHNHITGIKVDQYTTFVKKYGRWGLIPAILAHGRVTGQTYNGSCFISQYGSFDTKYVDVTRTQRGRYSIKYPSEWKSLNLGGSNVYVMLTGIGISLSNSASPVKATLLEYIQGGFIVSVSGDATENDGDFYFEIKM